MLATPNILFMRYFCCLFFSLLFHTGNAQTYTESKVLEDLDFLSSNIKKYNPGLKQFQPKFDSILQVIRAEVKGEYKALQHFKVMAKVTALTREGHMSLGNWMDTIHNGFNQDRYRYLPFLVRIIQDEIYIWKVYSDEQEINDGDKILSINGKSGSEIMAEIRSHLFLDGNSTSNFHHKLNSGFSWMYYLYVDQSSSFEIEYYTPADDYKGKTTMRALRKSTMRKNYKIQYGISRDKPETLGNEVYYYNLEGDRAMLKLKSFNRSKLKNQKVKSKRFYKKIFEELQQKATPNLIVDLRGNTGGRTEMAEDILPYILREDTNKVYRTSVSWKGKIKEFELPEKSEFAFKGNIFVLVDGNTFSAGATLARYLKEYGGAVIIGEEGGGRYEGFVAGSQETLELPHSGIKVGIPRYSTIFPTSVLQNTKDRGILPDHKIEYSLEDLINETDLELKKLNSLLGN